MKKDVPVVPGKKSYPFKCTAWITWYTTLACIAPSIVVFLTVHQVWWDGKFGSTKNSLDIPPYALRNPYKLGTWWHKFRLLAQGYPHFPFECWGLPWWTSFVASTPSGPHGKCPANEVSQAGGLYSSICLVRLSIYLSIYLSVYLSVHLWPINPTTWISSPRH